MTNPVQQGPGQTMPCVRCGSPVPRSSQFCLACGTPTSTRSQAAALAGPEVPVQAAWQPTPVNAPILLSTIVPANYGRRVLAFLIDGAFGGVLTTIIALPIIWIAAASVAPGSAFDLAGLPSALISLAGGLYPLAMLVLQAFTGFSLGKRIMGLRIVKVETLIRPGIGRMLLRGVIVGASNIVIGIGPLLVYLSPLWDPWKRLRGWHDRLSGTWVIDVTRGPNPLAKNAGEIVDDVPAVEKTRRPKAAAPVPSAAPVAQAPVVQSLSQAPDAFSYAPPSVPAAAPSAPPVAPAPPASAPPVPVNPDVPSYPFAPASGAPAAPAVPPAPAAPVTPAAQVTPVAPPAPSGPIEAIPSFDPLPPFGGEDLDGTKLSNSVPAQALPAGTVTLLFDTGESYVIAGHGVLGRDPVSPYGAADDMLVQVAGDTRSISKTHLEFEVQVGSIWVTDRRSTNGSAIVRADGVESPITPGQRMTLRSGDRVRIGTRVFTLTVAP
ncbi:RDD family protein [Agreia sp. PsM10]|uniref:RDD family protein n=1 Tax=Agreia sp. PsM10 TaxID=3030533 RepID=UPI00263AD01E|nr:RDD family protein [Agreia sp. PsM10]MDN4640484.1 RDD family protein [Agreia sp. PsM10]